MWRVGLIVMAAMGAVNCVFAAYEIARASVKQSRLDATGTCASAAQARSSRLFGLREEKIILGAAPLTSPPLQQIMLPAQVLVSGPAWVVIGREEDGSFARPSW
ncbi:MAG: hypothetical protein U0840_00705 [Gemmataceae bacterium]